MRAYQTLVITLARSMLREPVGLFSTALGGDTRHNIW